MSKWLAMLSLQLCSCGIDDRSVDVRSCVTAPETGVVASFSSARLGRCSAEICPEAFVGSQIVALGPGDLSGRVLPSQASPNVTLMLGLRGDLSLERDETDALRVALQLDTLAVPEAGTLTAGFALELIDCVAVSGWSSLSFRAEGNLGACPLRAALRIAGAAHDTAASDCSLDAVSGAQTCVTRTTPSVDVSPGVTTLTLPGGAGDDNESGLVAVQWEASLTADPPRRCDLVFTLDDIRLLRAP
jgi:hypothetical protein